MLDFGQTIIQEDTAENLDTQPSKANIITVPFVKLPRKGKTPLKGVDLNASFMSKRAES